MPSLQCPTCANTTRWQNVTMDASGLIATCGDCGASVDNAAASSTSTISITNLTTTGKSVFGDGTVVVGEVTTSHERPTRQRQERPEHRSDHQPSGAPFRGRPAKDAIVFTGPVVFGTNSVAHGDGAQAYGEGSRAYGRGARAFDGAQAFDEAGRPLHDRTEPPAAPTSPPRPPRPGAGSSPSRPHAADDDGASVNIASDNARVGVQAGPVNIASDNARVGVQTDFFVGQSRGTGTNPPEPDDPPMSAARTPQPPSGPVGGGSVPSARAEPPAAPSPGRGDAGPAGTISGETRNIAATRTFLNAMAAAGDDRQSQVEQAVAALRRLGLDDQTIAEAQGVVEDCGQVAAKARTTLRAMDDTHRLMEEAVAATPQAADRDYYRRH